MEKGWVCSEKAAGLPLSGVPTTEDRGQNTEARIQTTEDRRQKNLISDI